MDQRAVLSAAPPSAPTLIYDGRCDFCRRWVGRVQRWDRARAVRYLPLQDASAPAVAGRSQEALRQAVHLVRPDGAVFRGAGAARELFRYLRGGWVPRLIMRIPGVMVVAERAYAYVARRWGPVR